MNATDQGYKAEPTQSRAQRRRTMREQNNRLWKQGSQLVGEYNKLWEKNRSMNIFLTWIAATVGVQAQPGENAADLLKARIEELVELERQMKKCPATEARP